MKKEGFDQVVKRIWQPHITVDEHTHPFDANRPHSERYGSQGATYWVARRNLTGRKS
jgi:hypothetical protein